jgi:DNA-binding NtrC family response regulator
MDPLHVRLVVSDPEREDVALLREALRAAGHVVVHDDGRALPPGVDAAADFVVTEGASMPTPESLEAAEARHIGAMLRFTRGNKRKAALLLGIARSTLLAKIRRYRLG